MLKKALVALGIVLVLQSFFALCLVSALQLLVLRSTPFGVTGASPVVNAVASKVSLDTRSYANESAVMEAIGQSKLYGAYLPGQASDTLIVVPAKSFFGRVEVEAAFEDAAKKLDRPLTVQTVKPLPKYDRLGGVSGLLLIPLLIGGYLAAVLLLKATRTAAAPWHVAMLVGYSAVGALLTDLIAGPGIGAYSNSHFWPLLPCFILIAASVALAAAAFQRLLGPVGTLVVATLFIIVGGSAAGGVGVTLLPEYWQHLGAVFPPQHAITLVRNVIYFNGNNITTPLIVLGLYALGGGVIVGYLGRWRPVKPAGAPQPADASDTPDAVEAPATQSAGPKTLVRVLIALAIAAVMQCLFTVNYMSSAHEPVATDMPFGTVGPSPLLAATEKNLSLKVSQYLSEQAAKDAIDQAEIYGALIPGQASNTLLVVPTLSDVAPLDLAANFEIAAKKLGQPLSVQQYAPHPLAKKDPFGFVVSLMLVPLLVGGYMASTMLRTVTGSATGRRRLTALLGFSAVAGLVVNLVVGLWLQGYPLEKFWIVWPILSLIVAVVALVAAVLQKLLGAAGTLVTVIVVMLFGNPSSGGANGVPYLPAFWRDIGPFLPPRNAYILLRNTIYFDGHGTTQALVVLLVYLAVPAIALALLDRFRTPEIPVTRETEAEATALTVPVGGLP
ncbi:hypothetical protein OG373_39340 [Streptomyces avidinii]|uniref:hypothetical protein n=1 Tax=Streptomyces avidinii TaxID=1895 RepID=UPI0038698040|nr:hypothetical protein OG373_39340 [Streptomyces avidinii]